jgi:NitT/TauT family transport system substrate-binding protein
MKPYHRMVSKRLVHLYALLAGFVTILILSGCSPTVKQEKIRIVFNPWPGYEFLYLAEQKGFFKANGLNIEMVPAASLSDGLRAFMSGKVNAMAATMSESVKAIVDHDANLTPVLVTNYSAGSDVIIAKKTIDSVKGLKGKPVGLERDSLGAYMLYRALQKEGMKFSDVVQVQAEQSEGLRLLKDDIIDAFVTYPPASLRILEDSDYKVIFDSSQIPKEIIDFLVVDSAVVQNVDDFKRRLHSAWQQAFDYYKKNIDEAAEMMAKREGISKEDFIATINDLIIVQQQEQAELLTRSALLSNALATCHLIYGEGFAQCQDLQSRLHIPDHSTVVVDQ